MVVGRREHTLIRWIVVSSCLAALAGSSAARAQAPAAPPSQPAPSKVVTLSLPRPLLPDSFAGWEKKEVFRSVTDPAQADKDNAAALKEYGFQSAILATYKKDGETLTIRAMRF